MKNQIHIKKGNREKSGGYIRNIIAAVAIINLILLFVFDYQVPGISGIVAKLEKGASDSTYEIADTDMGDGQSQGAELEIQFEEDTLKYNGEGAFDMLEGVKVVDEQGNIYNNDYITAKIEKKSGKKQKQITYTYSDGEGRTAEAARKVTLTNYEGPSITLDEEIPSINDDALDHLNKEYGSVVSAQDGYGKDITSEVKISAAANDEYDGTFILTFQVENVYGDTAKEQAEVGIDFERAHLSLTASDVSLKVGEEFKASDYVKYAVDKEGKDISDELQISGEVDTGTVGDYKVTYDISAAQEEVQEKVLTVHVAEN